MQTKDKLIQEIENTPEPVLSEVLSYLRYLKAKKLKAETFSTTLLSESTLAKDWLTPEEDEAWKDL
jgi:hypothetical protein